MMNMPTCKESCEPIRKKAMSYADQGAPEETIWMLTAYAKKDKRDLSDKEVKVLAQIVEKIKGGGR